MDRTCECGHGFPEELGKYGCPNCNGDFMRTISVSIGDIKSIEWKNDDACPVCDAFRINGHYDLCWIGNAIYADAIANMTFHKPRDPQ